MDLMKFFSRSSSKDVASNRLKLILIHDRATLSPEILENIKEDILNVISKYAEIDDRDIDVKITSQDEIEGASPALLASIPIKRMR